MCVCVCTCVYVCAHAVEQLVHVITKLNAAPSLSVVLNLQPEVPEVCCRLQRPVKEYRLFVIGCVTTAKQGGKKKRKNALGVEMSCEQLGSTTEHLRGVIDSRQCF